MPDEKMTYCYSVDEETFYGSSSGDGCYYSREDAVAGAVERLRDDEGLGEVGETHEIWTAEQRPAVELFRKNARDVWLVDQLFDPICDFLYDEVGEAVEHVIVGNPTEFAKDLRSVIEKHVEFNCFSIDKVKLHHHTVTAEDLADAT